MQFWQNIEPKQGFNLIGGTCHAQLATIALDKGEKIEGENNLYPRSDYWLYVLSGEGLATVEQQSIPLSAGCMMLIKAGEVHAIHNSGAQALKMLNIYAPAVYPTHRTPLQRAV